MFSLRAERDKCENWISDWSVTCDGEADIKSAVQRKTREVPPDWDNGTQLAG